LIYRYFYVVALKLKDGKEPASSDSYENSELVTYAEAENSTKPKPYIAAVVTSSGVDGNMFVLGDGRNTDDPTSRKRRSTTSDYFNGPLQPGTSYSVFQRIIINEMVCIGWGGGRCGTANFQLNALISKLDWIMEPMTALLP
jgi:hypothetical protein